MNLVDRDAVYTLLEHKEDITVSIYLPTYPGQLDRQSELLIRLRHFIDGAREAITDRADGMRTPEVSQMLQPALDLAGRGTDFWKHQPGGLALFLGRDDHFLLALPFEVEPEMRVGPRFYILPLLPALHDDGRFLLLAFSQNQVRLFDVAPQQIQPVSVPGMPLSLKEALADDDPEKQLQFSGAGGAPGTAGRRSVIFFGHGAPDSYKKDALLRYCHHISNGLWSVLRQEEAPLLLACVDYLFPVFQEVNNYPHLLPDFIAGNPDRLTAQQLHQKSLTLFRRHAPQPRDQFVEKVMPLLHHGRASIETETILKAAAAGRIETLWIIAGAERWGKHDPRQDKWHIDTAQHEGDEELVNLAAHLTLANNGEVHLLSPDQVPGDLPLVAFFRY